MEHHPLNLAGERWGQGTAYDLPAVAYVYAPDRKGERLVTHLDGFSGILQVDGYGGYKGLAGRNTVKLAFCWAHVRRRFYELAQAGPAPIASEALQRIAELYYVEAAIRGRPPDERQATRREKSRPIIEALEPWLRAKLALISQKTKLAEAIRYALSGWEGLTLFLDDGRVELDNNIVERSIRLLALTRNNGSSPAPTGVPSTGPSSLRWSRPASSTTSTPKPISRTLSPASSTATPTAASTTSCPGPTQHSPRSATWPDDDAYQSPTQALDTGLPEPRRVRGASQISLTSCSLNRQQAVGAAPPAGETREVFVAVGWYQGGSASRTLSSVTIRGIDLTARYGPHATGNALGLYDDTVHQTPLVYADQALALFDVLKPQ